LHVQVAHPTDRDADVTMSAEVAVGAPQGEPQARGDEEPEGGLGSAKEPHTEQLEQPERPPEQSEQPEPGPEQPEQPVSQQVAEISAEAIEALNGELVDAVWAGNADQVAKLVEMGASNAAADAAGLPVMRLAARRGRINMLASLCRAGPVAPETAAAALVDAAEHGHVGGIETILERSDVDINAEVPARGSALVAATCLGHSDCVEYLLAARAEVSATRFKGKTALQWAKELGDLHSVELLTTPNECDRARTVKPENNACAHLSF
jgi:hypothetical protein